MITLLSKKGPKSLVREAKEAVFRHLYNVLAFSREELKQCSYFWFALPKLERMPEGCIFGFTTTKQQRFRFFQAQEVLPHLEAMDILPQNAKKRKLVALKYGSTDLVHTIQTLPINIQRQLLNNILKAKGTFSRSMSEQHYKLNFSELENACGDRLEFAMQMSQKVREHSLKTSSQCKGADKINLAPVWAFLYWIGKEQIACNGNTPNI